MVTEKKKNVIVPKFIMEDGYIVKGGPKLNVFLKNVYGFNRLFFNFIMRRFEFKKNLTCVHMELFDKMYIKYFRYHLPQNKDFRYRYYAHLYLMFNLKLYKAYRQIMGLPSRGQRTWSNANNPFRCNVELRALFAQKAWRIYPFLTRTYSMTAALAELSNRLWKTNWLRDWRNAKDSIEQTRRSNIVKIDLFAMSKFFNRVELSDYKISKKTKQKKKIEKKGSFTTGLEPGFAKIFLVKSARELRHINLQFYYTKTTRMIFEKDNKKSKKKGGGLKLGKGVKSIKVARRLQKKKKKSVWD